jgi:ABC-type cobalamin/Fe3+-siderophores transport system ATPase subunit
MFSLRSIYHSYSGLGWEAVRAARRVDGVLVEHLDIPFSGVTAVIGPSGSGKTTLLSILAGFLEPRTGPGSAFTFDGRSILGRGPAPGDVAFVFQSSMLLQSGSVLLNILQGRVSSGGASRISPEEIGEMRTRLRDLGLLGEEDASLVSARARRLSGGERQRAAILRALLANPRAILCDEPTSSLDEARAGQALEALRRWSRDHDRPVIWVTHNLDQAARYADHFVFMAEGRLHEIDCGDRAALDVSDPAARRRALRKIVDGLPSVRPSGRANDGADVLPEEGLTLGRLRYAAWVAHALSTNGRPAVSIEKRSGDALASKGQRRFLSLLSGDNWDGTRGTALAIRDRLRDIGRGALRGWRLVRSYSGYGIALVLFASLAQIAAVDYAGRYGQAFSDTRLEDPAIARIVFDHSVFAAGLRSGEPPPDLYPGAPIRELEDRIRQAVAARVPGADLDRVQVQGRRIVDGSTLRFDGVAPQCDRALPLTTAVLNRDDPILGQMRFAARFPSAAETAPRAGHAQAATLSPVAPDTTRPVIFLSSDIVDELRQRCGLEEDAPIHAQWQAGLAAQGAPVRVRVAASVTRFPPLYPFTPQMIAYEGTFQSAMNRLDSYTPGPFRVATAYFPIEGFAAADAVLRDAGYTLRDDSAAAVETIRRIASLADSAPGTLIGLTLAGCAVFFWLAIGALLEMNQRVLALFLAHGFRFWDLSVTLVLHLLPAFLIATLTVAGFAVLLTPYLRLVIPPGIIDIAGVRDMVVLRSAALVIVAGLGVSLLVAAQWWYLVRQSLKTNLQE